MPVIETGVGNCHVYVDASADQAMALEILVNSKARRPSVCNAAETLLVHARCRGARSCRRRWPRCARPGVTRARRADGPSRWSADVRRRGPGHRRGLRHRVPVARHRGCRGADDLDAAIAHITAHGTGPHRSHRHVVAGSAADEFADRVDAAAVMVNASTAFTDGGEFGFGAEIGISTQKLHARGPMGLAELTSTKYVVTGTGQIRASS